MKKQIGTFVGVAAAVFVGLVLFDNWKSVTTRRCIERQFAQIDKDYHEATEQYEAKHKAWLPEFNKLAAGKWESQEHTDRVIQTMPTRPTDRRMEAKLKAELDCRGG